MEQEKTEQKEMMEEVGEVTETFELPYGYIDKEGNLHKEFEVREMTGADEENIAQGSVRNNAGKVITTVLANCVTRIGDLDKSDANMKFWKKIMRHLYIGDRNQLLTKLREKTYGSSIEFEDVCPTCGEDLTITVETDEIDVLEPPKDPSEIPFELPKGYEDDEGTIHKKGTFKIPTGGDQEVLHKVARKNLGKANTTLLFKCINELGSVTISSRIFRNMNKGDREFLLEKLGEHRFGPDFEIEVICDICGDEILVGVNPINFI